MNLCRVGPLRLVLSAACVFLLFAEPAFTRSVSARRAVMVAARTAGSRSPSGASAGGGPDVGTTASGGGTKKKSGQLAP